MLGDTTMNKSETIIIGLFIGIACPLLTFILFWWASALLHMYSNVIPLNIVIASALTGLVVGLLFDILFLKRWLQRFYITSIRSMIVLYIGLSVVAVAFFMGLPIGTITIGTIAGIYMGRRMSFVHADRITAVRVVRKTAFMTASVTVIGALPIGFLALKEQDILTMLEQLPGMSQSSLQGIVGFTTIIILCGLLFLIQYYLSKKAGLLIFNMSLREAKPTPH